MKISLEELLIEETIDQHYLGKINNYFTDLIKIQYDWRPQVFPGDIQAQVNNPTPEENLFVMGIDKMRNDILAEFIARATTGEQMRAVMISLMSYFKQLAANANFQGLNLTTNTVQRKLDLMTLHDFNKAYFDIYQEEIPES